jgi:HK97 family phage major capsid protein
MDAALRGDDLRVGEVAQWIASHGQESYKSAWLKYAQYGESCWTRFTPDEVDAMQQVQKAEAFRAMQVGVPASGGYGLPIGIDPTITLASNGAINPIRSLADVRAIGTYQLRLVTTDPTAVTAAYAAEGTEVGDNSPTLVQPTLTPHRWHSFVPFSVELGMDYPGLQTELLKLFADARDVLEATVFLTGNPTNSQPAGILNIGGTGSLTTAQQVLTATAATVGAPDIYALRQALPARWLVDGQWLMSPIELDNIYLLVPRASSTQPVLMLDDRSHMLPTIGGSTPAAGEVHQWSTMAAGATTGSIILLWGSWKSAYVIADRIGLVAELVPMLRGSNQRPTGMRGWYTYGRTDGVVAVPAAARYLQVR